MKQVFIKKGQVTIGNVPVPLINDNEILVQVCYSCISAGTELFKIRASGRPLIKKIIDQPQNIKKVLHWLRSRGMKDAVARVKSKVGSRNPIGYSAAGVVLETGKNIRKFVPGDRVACAGDLIANHSEFIAVPENLTVKVPDGLSMKEASTVALGSIALQGIRRCNPELGESIVVFGMGNLGQLTSQMLKSAGCKVIGIDINQSRVKRAVSLGMDLGLDPGRVDLADEVIKSTEGYGADAVIVTASANSEKIINQSMAMCRKKGRVVIIGNVGLNLDREKFYERELDLLISTSYGPGRYDEQYELKARDYPFHYVRWTENRNMKEYLYLLSKKKIVISSLIDSVFRVDEAEEAYEAARSSVNPPLLVLLEYNKDSKPQRKVILNNSGTEYKTDKDITRVAVVGAGGFVRGTHLPNLKKLEDVYRIVAICDKMGDQAVDLAEQCGADYGTTDYRKILEDKNVEMVLIATRHDLHAEMAVSALKAGKAVFVEKPLALNEAELEKIIELLEKEEVPLTVDFNRRFSVLSGRIKEIVNKRVNPLIINYRMNAGYIPADSWVHSREGGGRNIGEACHIYDLFNYFTESEVFSVMAGGISPRTDNVFSNDNFAATVKYSDGSVCNLIYTALGSEQVPKEQMEIYFDNKIIYLNDYLEMKVYGSSEKGMALRRHDKGHMAALREFGKGLRNKTMTIPIWQLAQATSISFEVEKQISGKHKV